MLNLLYSTLLPLSLPQSKRTIRFDCCYCLPKVLKNLNFTIYVHIMWGSLFYWPLQLGGPSWEVSLGRKDSTTANITAANTFIPPPTTNLSGLVANFSVQGLSFKNMVALSGNAV